MGIGMFSIKVVRFKGYYLNRFSSKSSVGRVMAKNFLKIVGLAVYIPGVCSSLAHSLFNYTEHLTPSTTQNIYFCKIYFLNLYISHVPFATSYFIIYILYILRRCPSIHFNYDAFDVPDYTYMERPMTEPGLGHDWMNEWLKLYNCEWDPCGDESMEARSLETMGHLQHDIWGKHTIVWTPRIIYLRNEILPRG